MTIFRLQQPPMSMPKSNSPAALAVAALLLVAAGCGSEPAPPPEPPQAQNPVEARVAPLRDMAAEADSAMRASQQRMQEEAEAAR